MMGAVLLGLLGLAFGEEPIVMAEPAPLADLAPGHPVYGVLPADVTPLEPPFAGQVTPASPHWDLEVMYEQQRHAEGLSLARARMGADPSDVEIIWQVVRFYFEKTEGEHHILTKAEKERDYLGLLANVERGLKLQPDHAHLKFARGIVLARLGTTRGIIASLKTAKTIEQDWLAAEKSAFAYSSLEGSEVLPCDAQLALGIFYRVIPDSGLVQALAGVRGGMDKSISYLERANACSPNRIRTMKELGVSYLCKGTMKKDEALIQKGKDVIAAYASFKAEIPGEIVDKVHGPKLIENPKMACDYSRDGQQDKDRRELERQEKAAK